MAAGRWVGRGDKDGGDGAAVDAMRELVNSVSMRGVVVIGEGEKDNAPMLYNGEEVGNGDGPDCDFAVDPVDGTTLMAKGMPERHLGARGGRARRDVRPVGGVLHEQDRGRARRRRRHRHHRARSARTSAGWPRCASPSVADITVCVLDRPRHTQLMADVRGRRRADPAHLRRRRRRRHLGVPARLGHRHARRHRRHPGGHHHRRRDPLHGRRDPGRAGPDRRRRTTEGPRRRATTSTGCCTPRTWCPGTTSSSPPPASPTATCCKGVRYFGGGCTTQSIVMRSKSGTVRMIEAYHRLSKLNEYSAVDFTGDLTAAHPLP